MSEYVHPCGCRTQGEAIVSLCCKHHKQIIKWPTEKRFKFYNKLCRRGMNVK